VQSQPAEYKLEGANTLRFLCPLADAKQRFNAAKALIDRLNPA
jgi:hypothetical protein